MALKRNDVCFPVTLFYDGSCPLCNKEVNWLKTQNKFGRLMFEDIKEANFSNRYPALDSTELDRTLHAKLGDGRMVKGVDATISAWEAVGKGWMLTPLTWPVFSSIAGLAYQGFANNRHWLASVLTKSIKKDHCKVCK